MQGETVREGMMEELLNDGKKKHFASLFPSKKPCFVGVIQREKPEAGIYCKRQELGLCKFWINVC